MATSALHVVPDNFIGALSDGRPFAIYCRLSRKPAGRKRRDNETVERQEALCRAYAAEQGITVGRVFIDNHRSAWKADGERPAWDSMVKACRTGEFAGILAYKLDRFSRNVRDAEDLVDLGDKKFYIDGPNSGRVNLNTAHGRKVFREAAVQGAGESDNTSERARDALADRAARGLQIGGGRLYGFEVLSKVREYDDDVEPVQRPAEAEVIREVARRMLADEPVAAIAADLNERGLPTVRGGQWTGTTLARMIGAPRNGGYVVLNGQVVARNAGEPILDAETYAKVQAILAGRRRGRRPTGQYLSKVIWCGNPDCGQAARGKTMAGYRANGSRRRTYICAVANGGCGMSVVAEPLEAMIRDRVLADAADPDLRKALDAEGQHANAELSAIGAEIGRLDNALADLEDRHMRGTIREHAYETAKATHDHLMTAALAKQKAILDSMDASAGGVTITAAEYDEDMSQTDRSAVIRKLRLRITVMPQMPDSPRNRFDSRRVRIEPMSPSGLA